VAGQGRACTVWGEIETGPVRLLEAKTLCELRAMADDQGLAESWYRSVPIRAPGGISRSNW